MTVASSAPRARLLLPLAIAALLAALFAGWWQFSPRLAIAEIRSDALAGDASAVAARIDFPALRQSLKAELRADLDRRTAPLGSPMQALGLALADGFIDPMVDSAVTPESLGVLVRTAGDLAPAPALRPLAALAAPDVAIARDGLDRFRLTARGDPAGPALLFVRDGLGWKLAGVDLPDPSA